MPSKIDRSCVAGVASFTRDTSRVSRDIATPRRSNPPCPCERCLDRLAAAISAALRPSTAAYSPALNVSVGVLARDQAPR